MSDSPALSEFHDKYPDSALVSRFDRLWTKISEKWGSEECYQLLEELVVMEDDKNRQGFDFNVMSELLYLSELLVKQHPEFARPKFGDDIWKVDFSK